MDVREAVAEQGYESNELVYDEYEYVCEAVARQGYRLDILYDDYDFIVRNAVDEYLNKHSLSIKKWCKQHDINYINMELKNLIYKIQNSSILYYKSEFDPIELFFDDISIKSYENKDSFSVTARDTNQTIFTLEKNLEGTSKIFKFIVDIEDDNVDIVIKNYFYSIDEFKNLIQSLVDLLNNYSWYSKYAYELEKYLL